MLETDVLIDFTKGMPTAISWFESLDEQTVTYISGFTYFELLTGCRNKVEVNQMRAGLKAFTIAWPSVDACNRALAAYSHVRLSHGVSMPDALTAYCAIELSVPICTFNVKHYRPFDGLETIQPYQRPR